MKSATLRMQVRTRRRWAFGLARPLIPLRLWPLVDGLLGLVRVEYRAVGWTDWADTGVRVVRHENGVALEQVP